MIPIIFETGLSGSAQYVYQESNFTYHSTFDGLTNLYAKVCYDNGFKNRPIVLLQHGLTDNAESISQANMRRYASYGFFVLSVGLRGNNGASGVEDNAGRDLFDIYDAINEVKTRFGNHVDKKRISMVGFSNGCASMYNMCSKFPDLFNHTAGYFGISDYGTNPTSGWWYNVDTFTKGLIQRIGGTPAAVPSKYLTRYSIEGFENYLGKTHLYHDADDTVVQVSQSRLMVAEFPDKITYLESNSASANRFLHGYPDSPGQLSWVENQFIKLFVTSPELKIKNAGTFSIRGFIITKKFQIIINDATDTVANLIYNLGNRTFDIEPITGTGNCTVKITYGSTVKTVNISGRTLITI